jgi:hypothetical protein
MSVMSGRGRFLRGLMEQQQYLLSSIRTKYYFPKLTASPSNGRRLGYWHADISEITAGRGRD